ncbi:hypothetical protein BJF93_20370 [Xaviernesmea oryzae]|uniref:Translocation and assembly module TamB C-terminal domain-containing protein n=1 Tax=Xaviernesmea oryzae TaxID=464029 RepID=A0A1Q9AVZ0_9HYPH|nr:translocation/assembly module TamB domain-containing protein [Xaviernesmea oryzae]OLP59574.1 hypothetical protein BJF93_20370 [Xaviernesmea oryzae]SEM13063.1 translocation and assembly module TamB [Xaviernesmea oryzae]
MTPTSPTGRVLRWLAATLGILVVILVFAVALLGLTTPGARIVAGLVERYAATPDLTISISEPGPLLTGRFRAGRITLSDSRGAYAVIDSAELVWHPLALLSGRLDADSLTAQAVRIERQPVSTQPSQPSSGGFTLPIEIQADVIDIRELMLGKALVGQDERLTLQGSLAATSRQIAAKLNAAELARPDAKLNADFAYAPEAATLKLDAALSEPKGGVLARLLQLPNDPAVGLTLKGDGPLTDWQGAITGALDGEQVLSLNGRHQLTADGVRSFALAGGGRFAGLMPPASRPLFEGETAIDIAASMDAQTPIRIDRGRITTGALNLTASGAVTTAGKSNLQAELTGPNGPLVLNLPVEGGQADITLDRAALSVTGRPEAARVDLSASLAKAALPQVSVEAMHLTARTDSFNLSARTGRLDLALAAQGSHFADPNLDRLVKAPLTVAGPIDITPETIRFDRLILSSQGVSGTVNGFFGRATQALEAAFDLAIPQTGLPDAVQARVEGPVALSGRLSRAATGALALNDLDLKASSLTATGSAKLENGQLKAALSGQVPDLGKLAPNASGAAQFSAELSGPLADLAVKAQVTSPQATVAGRQIDNLALNAQGTLAAEQTIALTATGALNGQAVEAQAKLERADGTLSLPDLAATIGENKITGALAFTPDLMPTGSIAFDLPDLKSVGTLAGQTGEGQELTGDLKGTARFGADNGRSTLSMQAEGQKIERGALSVDQPRVDLTVSDLKTLAAEGRITARAVAQGENRVADATVTLKHPGGTGAGGETALALNGTYDKAPLALRATIGAGAGGSPSVTVQSLQATPRGIPLTLDNPTTLALDQGALALPETVIALKGGEARLSGRIGTDLDVTLKVEGKPAVEFATPIAGGEARVAIASALATVKGPMTSARIDATADLAWLATPQARLEAIRLKVQSPGFNLTGRQGTATARVEAARLNTPNADLARLVAGPLVLNGTVDVTPERIGFNPVTLDTAGLDGRVTGAFTLTDGSLDADIALTSPPAALPAALAGRIDTPLTVNAKVARAADGALNVHGLRLDSGSIKADGQVSLEGETLAADLKGSFPDLGKLLGDAKGSAGFTLSANGPVAAPAFNLQLNSAQATLVGRPLRDLTINATGTASRTAPQATIKGTGSIDTQPVAIDVAVQSAESGGTTVPALNVTVGPNRINGALAFSPDFKPSGNLTFTLPDISLIAALAGQRASGDLAGTADITTRDAVTSIVLKANGTGLKRDDLVIERPVVDLTISDLAKLAINGRLQVATLAQGANRVTGLSADFDRSGDTTRFAVNGRYDEAPLVIRGDIAAQGAKLTLNLAELQAAPRRIALKLAAPTAIAIENGTVSLSGARIGASDGTITVNGSAGQALDLAVRLDAVPARLINAVAPTIGAEGAISGTITAKGTAQRPDVTFDLGWRDASLAQTRSAGVGKLAITAKGQLANQNLRVDTTLSGSGGLSFKGGGTLRLEGNRPLNMRFAGRLPFGLAEPILAAQGFTASGTADLDIAVGGSVSAPAISGTINTAGARLTDVRRNLTLNNLTAAITLEGQQARINRLTGRLATGGSLTVTGTVGYAPGANYPADLAIRLDKATYVDGTLVTADVTGALTLKGPLLGQPTLAGTINIEKAAITVPQRLPGALSELDIKHRKAPADVKRMEKLLTKDQGQPGERTDRGIALDVKLSAPSKLYVRGRGIDAELGGDLTIQGTAAAPAVSGGFTMRRGRLDVIGRRLTFSEGTITFGGGLIPTLNLSATSTTDTATVTVTVAGEANDPNIVFSSSPSLPQDEILAQLIFRRSLSNLSPVQIAQLASAVAQLAGGSSTSLLDGLRNQLGVDDLDVSTDAGGGALVRAGRYLNDRTYLELQQSAEDGAKAVINLDVGRGVKLKGEAGSEGGGAGIFYEREY